MQIPILANIQSPTDSARLLTESSYIKLEFYQNILHDIQKTIQLDILKILVSFQLERLKWQQT
jgi:hypothetical protein